MKKFLFFLLFVQTITAQVTENVAIWNKFTPEYKNYTYASDMLRSNLTVQEAWAGNNGAYAITDIHTNLVGSEINYDKYIEFKLSAKEDKFISLNYFSFAYLPGDDINKSPRKVHLRYSKSAFANNNGEVLGNVNIVAPINSNTYNKVQVAFPQGTYIEQNQMITVRMYFYDPADQWYSKFYIARFVQGNHVSGPMINATVSTLSGNSDEVLARWINSDRTAHIHHNQVTASAITTTNGINIENGSGWNAPYFKISGWNANNTATNKYFQLVVGSNNGSIKNPTLNIGYIVTNSDVLTVQYSKNFTNGIVYQESYNLSNTSTWANVAIKLANISAINSGEKLYIRFMLKNPNSTNSNGIYIRYKNDTQDGILLNGAYNGNTTESSCFTTTVWNGTSWSTGLPAMNKKVVLNANLDMNNSIEATFNACELEVANGVTLTIASNKIFTVKNNIKVNGTAKIIVENNGSLVQINENSTYTGTPYSFNMHRTTPKVHRFDYTYWSSPVKANADVFLLGKNPSNLSIAGLSPNTLSSKYHSWDMNAANWINHQNGNIAMEAGKGYIVRAPNTADYGIYPNQLSSYKEFSTTFIGVPNSGVINTPLIQDAWALVGNPYPSAISLETFFDRNIDLIEGTAYIWTHETSLALSSQSGNVSYNNDDYIAVNALGSISNKTRRTANGGFISLDVDNIAAGQSFFVKSKPVTSANPKVMFTNEMRVTDVNQKAEFFAVGNTNEVAQDWSNASKHRLWLAITNAQNDRNEMLVGYMRNATNGIDPRFDGEIFSGKTVSIYSIVDETNLTIQGRALPFVNNDVVKIGYNTTAAGTLKINLDAFDGIFTEQNVYLFDKELNIDHDIKNGDYTFNSAIGTFDNRFEIRYTPTQALGIDTPTVDAKDLIIYKKGNQIAVNSQNEIKNIEVYDLTGKMIYAKAKVNTNQFVVETLNVNSQMVIVKVTNEDNYTKTQKVILN